MLLGSPGWGLQGRLGTEGGRDSPAQQFQLGLEIPPTLLLRAETRDNPKFVTFVDDVSWTMRLHYSYLS